MSRRWENTDLEASIHEGLLDALLRASKRYYPFEFFSLLGGEKRGNKILIKEIIYVPWKEGHSHAIVDLAQIPWGVIGSFHSHPSGAEPSPSDLASFPLLGHVHIISSYPFTRETTRAYDNIGRRIRLVIGQ